MAEGLKRLLGVCAAAALPLGLATSASAAVLVDFKPFPASPTTPEFLFDGTNLNEAAGSIGNGDGALAPINQAAPGLQFDVPFIIPAVAGSSINGVSGSTTFYDATLAIGGFGASAGAQNFFGTLVQPLGPGDFTLTATDGTLLLHGTVTSSAITGGNGGGAGATFSSSNVSYDGGLIFAALAGSGGSATGNDFSFSLLDVTPGFGINGGTTFLNAFTANATGLFNAAVLPEPTGLAVAGLLAAGALGRRRRQV
jgi:hypothetical protein